MARTLITRINCKPEDLATILTIAHAIRSTSVKRAILAPDGTYNVVLIFDTNDAEILFRSLSGSMWQEEDE